MMASDAAPHSTASIWMTVGVLRRDGLNSCFRRSENGEAGGEVDSACAMFYPSPSFSLMMGKMRLTGRCDRVTICAEHNIPPVTLIGAPFPEDQRKPLGVVLSSINWTRTSV